MRGAPLEPSLWAATAAPAPKTPELDESLEADVLVVGAGYTGLSTAIHLARRGVDVVVVEAREAGWGGSGRNAGHCTPTFAHHEVDEVRRMLGPEWGDRFVRLQADAAELVFGLIRDYEIDCEARQNGYLQVAHASSMMPALAKRCEDFAALGKGSTVLDAAEVAERTGSERYFGGWLHPEGGHLNPLGYCRGLARAALGEGARIYTRSPVLALKHEGGKWRARTAKGSVAADKVVIGTGAYTPPQLWPGLTDCFFVLTAYCLATQPLSENVRSTVLPANNHVGDSRRDTHFFKRDDHGRIVTAGFLEWRRGRDMAFTRELMTRRFKWLFPQLSDLEWEYCWYGDIDFVRDMLPGLYELAPGLLTAFGYSGRGVPTATAMGTVLAEYAYGTPAQELAVRVSRPRPERARALLRFAPSVVTPFYRRRDARLLARDGIAAPPM